ncbi:MAG: YceI family protein [Desulfobacterales bacterium]|nr:MAG: YceI family protein [Desulfobacterales bacterium]
MMKTKYIATPILFFSLLILTGFLVRPATAAETYNVDPVHSYILFRVKHLDIGYSYGRFNDPSGTFVFDDSSPANSSIEMQVKAGDLDTYVPKRDNHLKSADFFDVEQHPLIAFKSSSIKKIGDDTYEVAGDLSLRGQTRPITVEVRQIGAGKDPWGNYRRGFETSFTIKRSEFGMDFMLNGLSDEVNLTVSVEGIRQEPK